MANRLVLCVLLASLTSSCFARSSKTVDTPPELVKQPPSGEVAFITTNSSSDVIPIKLECEAVGKPSPSYRWLKNGKPFDLPTMSDDRILLQPYSSGNLVITRPHHDDAGVYQCFAENYLGVATSNAVFLREAETEKSHDPQRISLFGIEGQPLGLKCDLPNGWPKPQVDWIRSFTNRTTKSIKSSRISTDPDGRLWFSYLTIADASDDFEYTCVASTMFTVGSIRSRYLVNVISTTDLDDARTQPVEQYISQPEMTALKGRRHEIHCIFGGRPVPKIQWFKDDKEISTSSRVTYENYGKTLIITSVDSEDAGTYTCQVNNGIPDGTSTSRSFSLKVHVAPYFIVEPQSVNVSSFDTVHIQCEAGGEPLPEIQWTHNGKPIAGAHASDPRRGIYEQLTVEAFTRAPQKPETDVTPSAGLKATTENVDEKFTVTDMGNYGCNFSNVYGYVYKDFYVNFIPSSSKITESHADKQAVLANAETRLGVRAPTHVVGVSPQVLEVTAGHCAKFNCTAIADESLHPEITWAKDGRPVKFDEDTRFTHSFDYSVLVITETEQSDSGTYTCTATTSLDESSASATLSVRSNQSLLDPVDKV